MPNRYLIDTDVIVEYLRGREAAIEFLEGFEGELLLSVITVAELYSGVKGEEEKQSLEQFLLAFEVIPIDEDLAKNGGLFRNEYYPSHGIGLADALIAATASEENATLVTFNRRHYPMLDEVIVPYSR